MTRKSRTFGQLLRYMARPDQLGPPLLHNLRSAAGDLEGIRREFFANSKLLPRRKNGVVLYHEILSFGAEDREQVTPAIAEAVARQYLETRAPYALAYARAHFDTGCPHVHVLISANAVASSRRLRLSQAEFEGIKQQLNKFVRQQFPQLEHSGREQRQRENKSPRLTRAEQERRRRGEGKESRKETVRRLVAAALLTAASWEDCRRRLLQAELRLYCRGRTYGVVDDSGRRYRLRTLGLAELLDKAQRGWRSPPRPELPAPHRERAREVDRGR